MNFKIMSPHNTIKINSIRLQTIADTLGVRDRAQLIQFTAFSFEKSTQSL